MICVLNILHVFAFRILKEVIMKHIYIILLLAALACTSMTGFAQQMPEIYGLNFINSQLSLASLDPSTGQMDIISPNPISPDQFGSGVSDIDPVSNRYFYVRANRLYTVGLNTGRVIQSPALRTAQPTIAPITNIAFNWLNDTIYGLQFTTGALHLAAVDPANGQVQVISPTPVSPDIFSQGDADIDPVGRKYFYIRDRNQLVTVDLNTGLAVSKVRVRIPASYGSNASFLNISYNFMDGQMYGLVFEPVSGGGACQSKLYLAKVDPQTGAITVLSQTPTSGDCFQSGVCDMDPISGRYFYPRGSGSQEIVVVDTKTGNVIGTRNIRNAGGNSPVYITNIAFNELYNNQIAAPIPMRMGDQGVMDMGSATSMKLNAFVGPDAQYRWQDGTTDPVFTATQPGRYQVDITRDGFTVKGEVTLTATTTSLPTSLTPDTWILSPNPVHDVVQIAWSETQEVSHASVSLFHIHGQKIRSLQLGKGQAHWVQVSDLPAGVYLLRLDTDQGRSSRRFVKY